MSEVTSVPKHNQRIHPENCTHLAILLLKQLCYLVGTVLFMSLHRSYQVHLWVSAHVPKMLLLGCLPVHKNTLYWLLYTTFLLYLNTQYTFLYSPIHTSTYVLSNIITHLYYNGCVTQQLSPNTWHADLLYVLSYSHAPRCPSTEDCSKTNKTISAQGIACLLPPICSTMNMISLNVFNPAV